MNRWWGRLFTAFAGFQVAACDDEDRVAAAGWAPGSCAPWSMEITGSIPDWEEWTGMRFPESWPCAVPGAPNPIGMDLERNLGIYEEPNVRMRHPIGALS